MIVQCRSHLHDRVDVGNGDKDLGGPVGHGLGNGKLIQIARIIVVDGAPEKASEVLRRGLNARRWAVDSVELDKCLAREIRNQPSLQHHPVGNAPQNGAVLFVVGVRHYVIQSKSDQAR